MAQSCNRAGESADAMLGSVTGSLSHKPWDMVLLLHTAQACLHSAAVPCFGRCSSHKCGPVEERAEKMKIDQISTKLAWQGWIEDRRQKTEE